MDTVALRRRWWCCWRSGRRLREFMPRCWMPETTQMDTKNRVRGRRGRGYTVHNKNSLFGYSGTSAYNLGFRFRIPIRISPLTLHIPFMISSHSYKICMLCELKTLNCPSVWRGECAYLFLQLVQGAPFLLRVFQVSSYAESVVSLIPLCLLGVTFPSGEMQRNLVHSLYQEANITPEQVEYIEAHGTGTKVSA